MGETRVLQFPPNPPNKSERCTPLRFDSSAQTYVFTSERKHSLWFPVQCSS